MKIYLRNFLEEAIRQRYAPISQLGADNEIIFNKFSRNEIHSMIFDENIPIFNNNIAMMSGFTSAAQQDYSPILFRKGFPEYLKKMRLNEKLFGNFWITRQLRDEIEKIINKKYTLVVIGYGGAMQNILYNLFMFSKYLKIYPWFQNLFLFENDILETTNIFRIGKPLVNKSLSRFEKYKTDNLNYQIDNNFLKVLPKIYAFNEESQLAKKNHLIKKYFTINDAKEILEKYENVIFIGAPDFETRQALHEMNAPFIMIGHSNNAVSITKCPKIEGLITETYGSIDIPVLLMNLWGASYKFIELLANSNINLIEPDTNIFRFDFDSLNDEEKKYLKEKFKENRR